MSIILTQLQNISLVPAGNPPIYQKDPLNIGTVLGTSLYASSVPSTKQHSDDQALVGATQEGYPFFLCVDGFHGCEAERVYDFIQKEVLRMVEIFQLQLQQGALAEEVVHIWQREIFKAKQDYLNRGVDFSLGAVVTFSHKNKTYAAGWSIGDIGMIDLAP